MLKQINQQEYIETFHNIFRCTVLPTYLLFLKSWAKSRWKHDQCFTRAKTIEAASKFYAVHLASTCVARRFFLATNWHFNKCHQGSEAVVSDCAATAAELFTAMKLFLGLRRTAPDADFHSPSLPNFTFGFSSQSTSHNRNKGLPSSKSPAL